MLDFERDVVAASDVARTIRSAPGSDSRRAATTAALQALVELDADAEAYDPLTVRRLRRRREQRRRERIEGRRADPGSR